LVKGSTFSNGTSVYVSNASLSFESTLPSSILPLAPGEYYWGVKSYVGTSEQLYTTRNFYIDTIRPNIPLLTSPMNLASIFTGDHDFIWSFAQTSETYSSPVTSTIELSDNINFSTLLETYSIIDFTKTITLEVGTYYWRVRNQDGAGNYSDYTEVRKLTGKLMKSKGFTYILLIIVAIIWYNVFFRVKSNLMGEEKLFSINDKGNYSVPITKKDTFKLKANYKDPFGNINNDFLTSKNKDQALLDELSTLSKIPPEIKKIIWPQIEYKGLIKKSSSEEALCLLKINGELFNLLKGDYFLDNLFLKDVNKDYIEVEYNAESKVIELR